MPVWSVRSPRPQLLPELRYGLESEPAQLNLLPGGDVQNAVASRRESSAIVRSWTAPDEALAYDAHHEFAGVGLSKKTPTTSTILFPRRERRGPRSTICGK